MRKFRDYPERRCALSGCQNIFKSKTRYHANKESLPNYESNSRILVSMSLIIYLIDSQRKIILWDEDL